MKAAFIDDVNRMNEKIILIGDDSSFVKVNRSKAKEFFEKLNFGEFFLTKLIQNMKASLTPQTLSDEIFQTLKSMKFGLFEEKLSNIFQKSQEFNVLQEVSDTNFSFPIAHCANSFKTVVTYLQTQNILTHVKYSEEAIELNVESLLKTIFDKLRSTVDKNSFQIGIEDVESFEVETSLGDLIFQVVLSLSKLNVDEITDRNTLRSLNKQEKKLGFLKSLRGDDSDVMTTTSWKAHATGFNEYLGTVKNFNDFVVGLYEALSTFEIQKDVSRYNVLDLSNWGEQGQLKGIHIERSNFKLFMEKVKLLNIDIEAANKISRIAPSDSQLSILNNALMNALENRVVVQCPRAPDSVVTLKGNFIKFSDFLDSFGKLKDCGWSNVASLEIYALNSIFIDQDLNALGARLKVSIAATTVEIIGTRKIILNGRDGQPLPKAANGTSPGGHGKNGSPGLPGGSAGAFIAVAFTFVNGENLEISANGGKGGRGQSGGDGANGTDGATPPAYELNFCCDKYQELGFRSRCSKEKGGHGMFSKCLEYTISGQDGAKGGNAGSCGIGGQGGLKGETIVMSLTKTPKPIEVAIDGKKGENGTSGQVGSGGRHGDNRILWQTGGPFKPQKYEYDGSVLKTREGIAAGGNASDSCNSNIPTNPLAARFIQNGGSLLRNFKIFLVEKSNERLMGIFSPQIIKKINKNPKVRDLQDTLGLIEEHKMLENFPQESNINLLPYYEIHLANIESYASNPKESEKSDEYKKVLSYLYKEGLTRILNIKEKRDSDLIIDISGYLDVVSRNIRDLSALQDDTRLVNVVNTLKDSFKREIDTKIRDAQEMIEISITPELNKIISQFDGQISVLVSEINSHRKKTKDEIAALEEKKKELRKAMIISTAMGVFNVIGKSAPILGSIAGVVGTVSSTASALSKSIATLTPANNIQTFQLTGQAAFDLSKSVKNDLKSIGEVTENIEGMEKTLEKLEKLEKSISEKFVPLLEKIGSDLINTASNLNAKASVSLDVASWQVQKTLKDTSLEIQQFTRGYEVNESVKRMFEKLEEVMTVMVKVYDRIQEYQKQQRLSVYLADLSSASVKQIVVSDPKISDSFRELQISIRSNIILNQYNSALNAFKQWIFPFAGNFLENLKLPTHLDTNSTDLDILASTAEFRMPDLKSQIEIYKTTITDFDKHVYLAQFNSHSEISKPFYVWKNGEHRHMITQLLAGEAVFAKAYVENAERDAIKFKFIELGFKSDDPDVQAAINENLLSFGINMTHLGTSQYKYIEQYFSITSPRQSISYSFEKSADGKAMVYNNVYNKLLSGDIMLSPYAMWELKLTLNPSEHGQSFEKLSQFSDKVDLVLEGSGSFVDSKNSNFDVEHYYKANDPIRLSVF